VIIRNDPDGRLKLYNRLGDAIHSSIKVKLLTNRWMRYLNEGKNTVIARLSH